MYDISTSYNHNMTLRAKMHKKHEIQMNLLLDYSILYFLLLLIRCNNDTRCSSIATLSFEFDITNEQVTLSFGIGATKLHGTELLLTIIERDVTMEVLYF